MNRFIKAISNILQRNKRSVSYIRKSTQGYIPGGTVSSTTNTVVVDAARVSDRVASTSNGQFVIKDTTLFYISGSLAFEPKVDETIIDGTESFKITKVEKHFANSDLVLYIVHC